MQTNQTLIAVIHICWHALNRNPTQTNIMWRKEVVQVVMALGYSFAAGQPPLGNKTAISSLSKGNIAKLILSLGLTTRIYQTCPSLEQDTATARGFQYLQLLRKRRGKKNPLMRLFFIEAL